MESSLSERDIKIREAMRKHPRAFFVPPEYRDETDYDVPIPIKHGQTVSQPTTVRMMLEWLDVRPDDRVLDVGSGSGWTTAILSELVKPDGWVVAVERIPELKKFGEKNCAKQKCRHVEFHDAVSRVGWPDGGPYDKILVGAASPDIPDDLIQQLRARGTMVLPVGEKLVRVHKNDMGMIKSEEYPHFQFAFVPLIT